MSVNVDPKSWRLSAGGIKYKLMNGYPKGSINEESGTIEEQFIIQASDLIGFINLSFPLGIELDDEVYSVSPNRRYPGASAFATRQLSWEPLENSLPCDPYGIDSNASAKTYFGFLVVTVTYVTGKQKDDENDAETLLEISADTSAEFLTVPVRGKAKWNDELSHAQQAAYAAVHGEPQGDDVKNPLNNVTKVFPQTQWNVRWPRINRSFVPRVVTAMRNRIGQVNSEKMPVLQNAVAETVMLVGFSYREEYTWREGWENTPATVEMSFLEKHVKQGGKIIGHNHFIQDESGKFTRLWLPDGSPVYAETDLNNLFPPDVKAVD